jgi:glycosyltransferase involved in cell wall biosynthesis
VKVLIVVPYFYPSVGGLENYALTSAEGLVQKGHTVLVATSREPLQPQRGHVGEIEIIRMATTFRLSNTPVGIGWFRSLRKILREYRPDVINAHLPVPGIADLVSWMSGDIPVVVTYHNDLAKASRSANALVTIYSRTVLQRTLRRATAIVVTSGYYADRSHYLPAAARREVVPIGIDLDRFRPEAEPSGAVRPSDFRILFVGSLKATHRHKGVDVLLKALAILRLTVDASVTLVGDGDAVPFYRAMAQSLGVEAAVTFAGRIGDEDLPGYYTASDVLVLPSTTEAEGFGIVLLEAQASGTPVVASRVGGIPYALRQGATGLLSPPDDSIALAGSLLSVHGDPAGVGARVQRGLSVVHREYSKKVHAQVLNELLVGVVREHQSA